MAVTLTLLSVTNVDDYLVRLIKGCVEMRLAPRMVNRVNMCPVDFVASAMVEISARQTAFGKCFHFVNPSTCVVHVTNGSCFMARPKSEG
jgi:L-aminoadipate-semialdehyde dehydrogenase